MRNGVVFSSSRELQSKGEISAASAVLAAHLCSHPGAGEIALELVRTHIKAGHVTQAISVFDIVPLNEAPAGLRLRLRMERAHLRLLQTFDVTSAAQDAATYFHEHETDTIAAAERADAERIYCTILHIAAQYRCIGPDAASAALNRLAAAAGTLLDSSWIDEGLSAALTLAQWQCETRAGPGAGKSYLAFAEDAGRRGRPDYAAEAVLRNAGYELQCGGAAANVRGLINRAQTLYQKAGHDLGLIDTAYMEARLRTARLDAAESELEDVLHAYESYSVPMRQLAVLLDLSSAAAQAETFEAAARYRGEADALAGEAGLLALLLPQRASEAEVLLCAGNPTEAAAVCERSLKQTMPQLLRGHFEKTWSSACAGLHDARSARLHLDHAIAAYDDVGASNLASAAVAQFAGETLAIADEGALRAQDLLLRTWASRDGERSDALSAATKHQLRAQTSLQLHRLARQRAADTQFLSEAEAATSDAVTEAEKLTGHDRARTFGAIAQLSGQIGVWRNNPDRAEQAYRNAIDIFDNAGLTAEAAHSRYIIGCMHLNAFADAAKRQADDIAARHFTRAESELQAALSQYDTRQMPCEAARALRMLAQLHHSARPSANQTEAERLRTTALAYASDAENALDDARPLHDAAGAAEARRIRQSVLNESRQLYELALAIIGDDPDATGQLWSWQQKCRAHSLINTFCLALADCGARLRRGPLQHGTPAADLIAADIDLSRQIAKAKGENRIRLRQKRTEARQSMAHHAALTDYLELHLGAAPRLESVCALLEEQDRRRTALVDFVITANRIGVMVTTREGIKPIAWIRAEPILIEHLEQDWRGAAHGRRQNGRNALKELDSLIAPLAELTGRGDHIVLCPSGALARLPLHALTVNGEPLIARNIVTYAPSIAMWRSLAQLSPSKDAADHVIADPSSNQPARRISGQRVAARLGVTPLTGRSATRQQAMAALDKARIFHFEGHAIADSHDARRSKLIFSDGYLSTADLLSAEGIDADLVVIAGFDDDGSNADPDCLAEALLLSGARAVIVPQWPIGADDAGMFLDMFYRTLQITPHHASAEALRLTQLELRAHERFASGSDWASYVLYGGGYRSF